METVQGTSFQLCGEVDLDTAPRLASDLAIFASTTSGTVVVDCGQLIFIDSTGIDVLIHAQRALDERGRKLQVVNLRPIPLRVVRVLGLAELFGVAEADPC